MSYSWIWVHGGCSYSVENGRGHTNFWIADHDMKDTYLPPYEMAIRDGKKLGHHVLMYVAYTNLICTATVRMVTRPIDCG